MDIPDSDLIINLASTSQKRFEHVYHTSFAFVFAFARRYVEDPFIAENIVLDSFLKLWNRFGDFESILQAQSFLRTTTRNACLNHLRDNLRADKKFKDLEYILSQDTATAIAYQDITGDLYQKIITEVEKLSPQLKQVLKLSFLEGLSNDEIAAIMGIANQSVRNHKNRALAILKKEFTARQWETLLAIIAFIRVDYTFLK